MTKFLKRLHRLLAEGDVRYYLHERYSLFVGIVTLSVSKVLYGKRLVVGPHYKVWGAIRFIISGPGFVRIGRDFVAVSDRKRSYLSLFTPCQMAITGNGIITIDDHVALSGTTIFSRKHVSIGKNVMIGPNTIIVDHDAHTAWPPSERWRGTGPAKEILIEDDVWIGMNCIVLKGVRIGAGSVIAAGSIVIKDVEPNCLYAGNPAKKIKRLDQG